VVTQGLAGINNRKSSPPPTEVGLARRKTRIAQLAQRLDRAEVNLKKGLIEVTAVKSKTAQRRLVNITHNLKEWLAALLANGELLESEAATLEDGYRLAAVIEAIEQSATDGNQCTVKFGSE